MKMIKYVTLTVMLFAASDLFAASTAVVKIMSITNWVWDNSGQTTVPTEDLNITTNEVLPINPNNCTYAKPYILVESSKISRSMLLTAFATKADVKLMIAGCSAETSRPLIIGITLQN